MKRLGHSRWFYSTLLLALVLALAIGAAVLAPGGQVHGQITGNSADVIPATVHLYIGNDEAAWRESVPMYTDPPTFDFSLEAERIDIPLPTTLGSTDDSLSHVPFRPSAGTDLASTTGPFLTYSTAFGGQRRDEGWGIAVDRIGNIYVSGITESADFAGISGYTGDKDIFVGKFSPSGLLVYLTLIGGQSGEEGNAIAVDDYGNAYIAGETFSLDFPVLNAWQPYFAGYEEAFLIKLDPDGRLNYATFVGGSGADEVNDIVADSVGNVYLGGETYSDDYPLMNPWSADAFGPEDEDGFITIFNAEGDMVYSTLISAPSRDQVFRIAVGADGHVYAAGMTSSPNFPLVNAFQTAYGGDWDDCFVLRLNPWNNTMIYASLLGGSGRDECWGLAVNSEGEAYVTGHTLSPDFPLVGATQPRLAGQEDAFVAKIAPAGASLIFSSFLGGSLGDRARDIGLDTGGNIYITGETESVDFPITGALQPSYNGAMDAFVAVLAPSHQLAYASYIGGSQYDRGYRLSVDDAWVVHIAGGTASDDFPVTHTVAPNGGQTDAFVMAYGLIPTPTPTPTPIPYAAAEIGPEGGAVWMSYPGHVTLLTVPMGILTSPAVFTLTYEHRADVPTDLTGVNHFFRLDSSLAPAFQVAPYRLPDGLSLALGFEPGPVIEDTVTLYHLVANTWTTDTITVTSRQPRYLQASVEWTGVYGLMGESKRVFLPALLKSR